MNYQEFLRQKAIVPIVSGLESVPELHPAMFPHQRDVCAWALRLGRSAAFLGTGMGKTLIELEWSRVIAQHCNAPVLILAPLAVAQQTIREAAKFGIKAQYVTTDPEVDDPTNGIYVTNYERLENFDPDNYAGVVLDESSILKSFDGKTRSALIDAFKSTPYKLCGTATPAPNDYMELGNHAEFLGVMTATEMLSMFFVHDGGETQKWRLKGHARSEFWKWVCSWAVSMRKPSDIGYSDEGFELPELVHHHHMVEVETPSEGMLFAMPAQTLQERIGARRSSIDERVKLCAKLITNAIRSQGIQSQISSRARRKVAATSTGLVSGEQGENRQGIPQDLHARVSSSEPREVVEDFRTAEENKPAESPKVRAVRRDSSQSQSASQSVAGCQSGEETSSEIETVRHHGPAVQGDVESTGRQVRDLRILESGTSQILSDDRSLPQREARSRASVLELQSGNWKDEGQPDAITQGGRVHREKWIVWANLNDEQNRLADILGSDCVSIQGSTPNDQKVSLLRDWMDDDIPVLISKASMFGYGLNLQMCHQIIFLGVNDSWEQFYQAERRCWRFGQTRPVHSHIIAASTEGNVIENLLRKESEAEKMSEEMAANTQDLTRMNLRGTVRTASPYNREMVEGKGWEMHLADCVDLAEQLPDDSIHYSIYSPPFESLYTYSNSERDMGNSRDSEQFWQHYRFLIKETFRVMMPGRLVSIHCMNLPTSKVRDGVIGIRDFRGEIIRAFEDVGFIYHSEVCIWKDPVTAMQRTKALGLLHKQIKKDAAMSRQGIPDYLVTMRKPGDNPERVTNDDKSFPVKLWQEYASPIWSDINPSDTLQHRSAREHEDERHICPLQLEVIRRGIKLWSNPGDTVWSPFAGIGSEGVVAIEMGREFLGSELKRSYWQQAVRNLTTAHHANQTLFDEPEPKVIYGEEVIVHHGASMGTEMILPNQRNGQLNP